MKEWIGRRTKDEIRRGKEKGRQGWVERRKNDGINVRSGTGIKKRRGRGEERGRKENRE